MAKLKPVGKDSYADSHGYECEVLMSWLCSIRDHEQELAEEKPAYSKRSEIITDAVDTLEGLLEQ